MKTCRRENEKDVMLEKIWSLLAIILILRKYLSAKLFDRASDERRCTRLHEQRRICVHAFS